MQSAAAPTAAAAKVSPPTEWTEETLMDLSPAKRAANHALHTTRYLLTIYTLIDLVFLPVLAFLYLGPKFTSGSWSTGAAGGLYFSAWFCLDVSRLIAVLFPNNLAFDGITFLPGGLRVQAVDSVGLACLQAAMLGWLLLAYQGEVQQSCLLLLSFLMGLNTLTSSWLLACTRLRMFAALLKVKTSPPILYSEIIKGTASECETCVICLATFAKEDMVVQLPCRHPFHPNCIRPWLQTSKQCPYRCIAGSSKQDEGLEVIAESVIDIGEAQDEMIAESVIDIGEAQDEMIAEGVIDIGEAQDEMIAESVIDIGEAQDEMINESVIDIGESVVDIDEMLAERVIDIGEAQDEMTFRV